MEEMIGVKSSDIVGKGNYEYSIPLYGIRKPILIDMISESYEYLQKHQYYDIHKLGNFLIADSKEPKPKGQSRIFKIFVTPLSDESGNIVGAIEGIHDITELRMAEIALRESGERYRTIVETSPVIIFSLNVQDDKKIINSINPSFNSITGWNIDEFLGKPISEIIHPEDHPLIRDMSSHDNQQKQISHINLRILSKSGNYLEGDYFSTPVFRDDTIYGETGIFLDLTERRKAERQHRDSEVELQALFSSIIDVVIVLDSEGRYLKIAPTNPNNLYKPADQLLGKSLYEIFPDKADYYMIYIKQSLKTKEAVQFEYSLPIGEKMIWFSAIISPMTEDSVILVARDISELKLSEEAIIIANKKLNLLSKITRHDIINLLAGLSGYLSLSLELVSDETVINFLKKAEQASESIQRQINFTREYQDVGVYKPVWQNIGDIINNIAPDILPTNITLTNNVNEIEIFADPLLEKVFYTLFENSIRHGGNVTKIHISSLEKEGFLNIIYEDDGIGIEENDKQRIFERGYGKHTGFGLFLSKEIVSITGLSMNESGQKDKGARFAIVIPKGSFRYSISDSI